MKTKNPQHYLTDYDFATLSKTEANPRARQRLIVLNQYKIGRTTNEIADNVAPHPDIIRRIRKRFWDRGIESIYDAHRTGRKRKIPKEKTEEFKAAIIAAQEARKGGRITGHDIVELAKKLYGVDYHLNSMYRLLNDIGISWISSRSKHSKGKETAREAF